MKTLISNGHIIDPKNNFDSVANLLIEDGKIICVSNSKMEANQIIDATDKIVCPGFIDVHAHEDPIVNDKIYNADDSIASCQLRMGVTTAIAGNCGENIILPSNYFNKVDKYGYPVNIAIFVGHSFARQSICVDKYSLANNNQINNIISIFEKELNNGAIGISFGLEYVPGADKNELDNIAKYFSNRNINLSCHIRTAANEVMYGLEEILDVAKISKANLELSHIGSMAGFGQMDSFLERVDKAKNENINVTCDCYPYYAFSTYLGEPTFDEGWEKILDCDYSAIELCEGKYKGEKCTKEIFDEERPKNPLIVCHVMKTDEVNKAIFDKDTLIASDCVLSYGQGHPRAAGTFPRFLNMCISSNKISLFDAINKITNLAAEKFNLKNKGNFSTGSDADIVIFDPNKIKDASTFSNPILTPIGIDYVLINGQIAVKNGTILKNNLGKSIKY